MLGTSNLCFVLKETCRLVCSHLKVLVNKMCKLIINPIPPNLLIISETLVLDLPACLVYTETQSLRASCGFVCTFHVLQQSFVCVGCARSLLSAAGLICITLFFFKLSLQKQKIICLFPLGRGYDKDGPAPGSVGM